MSEFYNRVYEILLDDESFIKGDESERQFRITFEVMIDYGGFVSYCDLAIFNLSDDTAGRLFKKDTKITLRCGYDQTIDSIFSGGIKNVFKERNGPDVSHHIIARGDNQPDITINRTLGVNTKIVNVIRECADAMGYPLIIVESDFDDVAPYARGYSLFGDPRVYLDKLAKVHSFSYAVDKGRLVVTRDSGFQPGTPHLVSQFTGMEGIPEITEVGCDVDIRLNPVVRIGGRIDIQSELVTFNFNNVYYQNLPEQAGSGVYRVFKIRHSGDSHGDNWRTRITGNR